MDAIPIEITSTEARRVLERLSAAPTQPIGPHPTEADAIAYVLETCSN